MRLVSLCRESEYLSAVPPQVGTCLPALGGNVASHLTLDRQRVPMLDASTLEERTRPALYGFAAARLRYFMSPRWPVDADHTPRHRPMLTAAKLARR